MQIQRNANRYNPIFNDQARRRPAGDDQRRGEAAMGHQNGFPAHQGDHQMPRLTTPGPVPVPQDPISEAGPFQQAGPVEPEKTEEPKAVELVAARQSEEIKLLTDANMRLRREVETTNTTLNERSMEFQRKIEEKDREVEEYKSIAFRTGLEKQRLEIQNKEYEQRLRP
ncbi:hypothetical protein B9Z55_028188 [Caenorhabditis nigoni]|uniref:Uncharacterized protein n=1 Tax=Caenorhabditis nigoni TaxID=1611254 RepID=A0A2G5SD51_9PELO|nr:hypothetical protein B9Z55_028188 [Caenorhabditis nigoni]